MVKQLKGISYLVLRLLEIQESETPNPLHSKTLQFRITGLLSFFNFEEFLNQLEVVLDFLILANSDVLEQVLAVVFAELVIVKADVTDGIVVGVEIKTVLHDKFH